MMIGSGGLSNLGDPLWGVGGLLRLSFMRFDDVTMFTLL